MNPELRDLLLKAQPNKASGTGGQPLSALSGQGGIQHGGLPQNQAASAQGQGGGQYPGSKSQGNFDSLINQIMGQSPGALGLGGGRGFPGGPGPINPNNHFNPLENPNPYSYKIPGMLNKPQIPPTQQPNLPGGSGLGGLGSAGMINLLGNLGGANPGLGMGGANMQNPMYLLAQLQNQYMKGGMGSNDLIKKEEDPNK